MIAVDKLLAEQCERTPDKVAIKHADRTITYRHLNETTSQMARYLVNEGIKPGDIIAVAIDRSIEMVLAIISIVKAGGAYLPIDNNLPLDRIEYMLDDAKARALFTSKKMESRYASHGNNLFVEEVMSASASLDKSNIFGELKEDSVSYILFTSGSTGRPKGVECTHLGLSNLLLSVQKEPGITEDDIILNATTISFDIAELELYLPLISGATLVLTDVENVRDGRALLEIAKKEKLTILQGTPFMWRTMLEAGWEEKLDFKIITGGEALPKELADRLLPRCRELYNMYGPTETTIYSTVKRVMPEDEVITIGHVIDNTQVYILDEQLNRLPDGEVGEIWLGGDGVAKGYLHKPELTAERFIEDKFVPGPGRRIYKTGDLGKILPNGEIHCLGRIDHQIKIHGYRVETEEIEFTLKQQDNVKQALINLYTDAQDNPHLAAYIVPHRAIDGDSSELIKAWKTALREKLPVYMVPDAFVFLEKMPINVNGKIDRKALPPPVITERVLADTEKPQTETEKAVLDICTNATSLPKIGVTDNLFDIGMDSLRAVKIMVQVEKQFGKRFPLSILLKYPTIRQFAHLIETGENDWPYHALIPIKPEGTRKPLYIVHGVGLNLLNVTKMVSALDVDQPVFGFQSVGLDGAMEPPETIEGIAKFYVDELLAHNANGPYLLAGYSFGGIIAFEMVRQLKEMGKDVDLLVMFDTNLQIPSHRYPMSKKLAIKFIRQFKKAGYRFYTLFTQPGHLFEFLKGTYRGRINSLLKKAGMLDPDFHPENMPKFMQDIAAKLTEAYYGYEVKPMDVKITLFKAAVRMFYVDDGKYLGWGKYSLKGVEVHNVPGDHKDMFDSDNALILAKELQQLLDKVK